MSISIEQLNRRIEATEAVSATLKALPKMTVIMTPQQVRAAVQAHAVLLDPVALSVLDVLASEDPNNSLTRSFRDNLEKIQAGG